MASSGALIRDTSRELSRYLKREHHKSPMRSMKQTQRTLRGLGIGAELWLEGVQAESVALSIFGSPLCTNMDEVRYYTNFDRTKAERLIPYSSHPPPCRIGRAALDNRGRLRGTKNIYAHGCLRSAFQCGT